MALLHTTAAKLEAASKQLFMEGQQNKTMQESVQTNSRETTYVTLLLDLIILHLLLIQSVFCLTYF